MNPLRLLVATSLGASLLACKTGTARVPPAAAAAADRAPAVVYVSAVPTVLVLPGDEVLLLVDGPVVRGAPGAPALEVSYLASLDPADVRRPDAGERAARTAAAIFRAFDPVLGREEVSAAAVTALFGPADGPGVGVTSRFARAGGTWNAAGAPEARRVVLPALPARVARTVEGEDAALGAARRFLEDVDARDLDAAWSLVSTAVKATTSRGEFERELRGATPAAASRAAAPPRAPCFLRYAARPDGFVLGDDVEVCLVGAGRVDTVHVRLDDDQEWRVAHIAHLEGAAGGRDRVAGGRPLTAP